ncbi:hypothetical protein AADZ90_000900 [Aestuariibius sp. 2305UL40-4]|uniref:hypothetical protein n=1 Tax=Aestuariibius violaceus TaxID=3234132 RepID=UPI00345E53E7
MRIVFKIFFLILFMCNAHITLATPPSDASYIVQRVYDSSALRDLRYELKKRFVDVYFEPISGFGAEITDHDRFVDIIPDEDVEPYLDRFLAQSAVNHFTTYGPEKIALIAAVLRADESISVGEIFSTEYRRKTSKALEEARARTRPSDSDDPQVIALEELVARLHAIDKLFDDDGVPELFRGSSAAFADIRTLIRYHREIKRLRRELNNPVTIRVVEADGILEFSSLVQRQSLLRQLSDSEDTGGIQFVRPPTTSVESR